MACGVIEDFALFLDGDQWLNVVTHHVGIAHVAGGRNKIGQEHKSVIGGGDFDGLHAEGVAVARDDFDAGQDFTDTVDDFQLWGVGRIEYGEVFVSVAAAVACTRGVSPAPVFALDPVSCAGKGGLEDALIVEKTDTAGVVEVQVGEDDFVDVVGCQIVQGQRSGQCGVLGVDIVDVAFFFGPLITDADIDQHAAIGVFDEQATAGKLDPVLFVAGIGAVPDRSGDDAEHGAAIESETGFNQRRDADGKLAGCHEYSLVVWLEIVIAVL